MGRVADAVSGSGPGFLRPPAPWGRTTHCGHSPPKRVCCLQLLRTAPRNPESTMPELPRSGDDRMPSPREAVEFDEPTLYWILGLLSAA